MSRTLWEDYLRGHGFRPRPPITELGFYIEAFNGDPSSRIAVNLWVGSTRYEGISEIMPGQRGEGFLEVDPYGLNYEWGSILRASVVYLDKWGGTNLIPLSKGGRWDPATWVSVTLRFKAKGGHSVAVEVIRYARMADNSRRVRLLIHKTGDVDIFHKKISMEPEKVLMRSLGEPVWVLAIGTDFLPDGHVRFARTRYPIFDGWLWLEQMGIASIKPLELPCIVEYLSLFENRISKLEGLDYCRYLYELWLNNNQIARIEGLEHCTHLKMLDLRDNQISRIEGLENCPELEILLLEGNQITAIEGLEHCRHLKQLDLRGNRIVAFEGLKECPELETVQLEGVTLRGQEAIQRYGG